MKTPVIFLFSILFFSCAFSQSSEILIEQAYLDKRPVSCFPLLHPNGHHHVLLTQVNKGEMFAQLILPEEGVEPVLPLLSKNDLKDHNLFMFLGYTAASESHYQLLFTNESIKKISVVEFDTRIKPAVIQIKEILKLPGNEHFLGTVGPGPDLDFLTIEKSSSIVHLYRIAPDGTISKYRFDLGNESFEISPFGTLYSALVANPQVEHPRGMKAIGISALEINHPVSHLLDFKSKLYSENGHVILTCDLSPVHTLAIDFNPDQETATVHRIAPANAGCDDARYPHIPSCYFSNGQIWQVVGCKSGISLQVYELASQEIVYSDQIDHTLHPVSSDQPSILDSWIKQIELVSNADPERVLNYIDDYSPRLSVLPLPNGNNELRLEVVAENKGFLASVMLLNMASVTLSLYTGFYIVGGPNSSVLTRSITYETVVNQDFEYVSQAGRQADLNGLAMRLMDNGESLDDPFSIFVTKTHLWALFPIDNPRKGYEIRGFKLSTATQSEEQDD